jgi:hypothetical protein
VPNDPTASDPNARSWASIKTLETYKSINGFWSSRWRTNSQEKWKEGTALVKTVDDWVFMEYEDDTNAYIIRARLVKDGRLVGRYMNCNSYDDHTAWVGIIVDNRRIDGHWQSWDGRWDFRR